MAPLERDRGLWLAPMQRDDLATFVDRVVRLDESSVIRLRARSKDVLVAWAATGFDVLVSRVVNGRIKPDDLSVGADQLARGLAAIDGSGFVEPGFAMDSAWRTALPPESGFAHLDDVPARAVLDLAQRGVELAREHRSNQGPPASLLDSEVVRAQADGVSVGVPMRCVFALTAMGFIPGTRGTAGGDFDVDTVAGDEIVRVRVSPAWLRVDARFGSVYRRHEPLLLR